MTRLGRWASIAVLSTAVACGGDPGDLPDGAVDAASDAHDPGDATHCTAPADCDDGTYCNGEEQCVAGACQPGSPVDCDDGDACTEDVCDEAASECESTPRDADDDGHGDAACGGDDCDDADPSRHPSAEEICDPAGVDEDCDADTFGARDLDGDSYDDAACCNDTLCGDDCDDRRGGVHPTEAETCDGVDQNCDGVIDEGATVALYVDADGDGHGDPARATTGCAGTAGLVPLGDDCDDTDPTRHPAAAEICDLLDNDCDGAVDDTTTPVDWYVDSDGDGFGAAGSTPVSSCEPVPGRSTRATDCDDTAAAVSPAAPEQCNTRDDDCDGSTDEGLMIDGFVDADRDGFGDASMPLHACPGPTLAALGTDCDDANPLANPGMPEICDTRDNDCDGTVDDGAGMVAWYTDADGDGFGATGSVAMLSCTPIAGRSLNPTDCDDAEAAVHPAAAEVCDGRDNDCSGAADEGLTAIGFEDADGDGHGNPERTIEACAGAAGVARVGDDCDDTSSSRAPGLTELCDSIDNDCDTTVDEGTTDVPWYPDGDGDGFGAGAGVMSCAPIAGHVLTNTDCDDANAMVHPAAAEMCDGVDNDCSGAADYVIATGDSEDDDGDGFLDDACPPRGDDCDDTDPAVHPGATESCDGRDEDCDGVADDGAVAVAWYADADGDGIGCIAGTGCSMMTSCAAITGFSRTTGDCDDADPGVYPGASDTCNASDDDCDGTIDEDAPRITACPSGATCGGVSDGCFGVISCGSACTGNETCGGGGTANTCGCTPRTCAQLGASCGTVSDGCGGTVDCGASCPAGLTCSGGGVANVCGAPVRTADGWTLADPLPVGDDVVSVWAGSGGEVWALANGSRTSWAGYDGGTARVLRRVGQAWVVAGEIEGDARAIWASSASDVWVVGAGTLLAHWNGTAWSTIPGPAGTVAELRAVWGSGPSDVWAVGETILHYDGTEWTDLLGGGLQLRDVWGSGASRVWAVGDAGAVYRWDGGGWSTDALPATVTWDVGAIWGSGPNDVWAFERNGNDIIHFDGASWSAATCTTGGCPYAIQDATGIAANDLVVVSSAGAVFRGDGTSWTSSLASVRDQGRLLSVAAAGGIVWMSGSSGTLIRMEDGVAEVNSTEAQMIDVWVDARGEAWAISNSGLSNARWHRVNGRWTAEPLPQNFYAVFGTAWNDVWMVGGDPSGAAVVEHYDGTSWSNVAITASGPLRDVWGTSPNDIWAVGSGLAFHWDGSAWTGHPGIGGYAVGGTSATDVYVAGDAVHHFDGTGWSAVDVSAAAAATFRAAAVWGSGPNDIWIVGAESFDPPIDRAIRWNGTSWATVDMTAAGSMDALTDVWGTGPNDVWISGSIFSGWTAPTTIAHFDGTAWTGSPGPSVNALAGAGAGPLWAAASGGLAWFDGTSWRRDPRSTATGSLRAVWAASADDVWAGGDDGRLLRREASGWYEPVASMWLDSIKAIWGTASNNVWFGAQDTLYRWDGSTLRTSATTASYVNDLHGTAATNMWAVGDKVMRYNGLSWVVQTIPGVSWATWTAVWSNSTTNVWIASDEGQIWSWNGSAWTMTRSDPNQSVRDLWASSPTDVWAVVEARRTHPTEGDIASALVIRWNGTAWTTVGPVGQFDFLDLHAIWGRSPTDVYVGGDFGAVYHWNGTTFTREETPTSGDILSLHGAGTRLVAGVGSRYLGPSGNLIERSY